MTRSSLTWVAGVVSPTSSKKIVPPLATSKSPALFEIAPVNDPFMCPNNSLSSNGSGKALQFTVTNGIRLRALL
jgi:hypothetical protein